MESEKPKDYPIVLEYTEKVGSAAGTRFWTVYPTKEDLDKVRDKRYGEGARTKIVAEGVSHVEAIRLCVDVPFEKKIGYAFHTSISPCGEFDERNFIVTLENFLLAEQLLKSEKDRNP